MVLKNKAQGTIEYLVIIGVIVVIALVAVSMLVGFTDSGSGVATATQRTELLTGTIAVTDTIRTPDGNYLLELKSNETGTLTIKNITTDSNSQIYYSNNDLPMGTTKYFKIFTSENCEPGETTTTNITITFETRYGTTQTQRYENVIIPCQEATLSPTASIAGTEETQTTPQEPAIPPIEFVADCFDDTKDPIPICNCLDLDNVREYMGSPRNFALQNDINMKVDECTQFQTGTGFEPIILTDGPYLNFDGNRHGIYHLFQVANNTFQTGLFHTNHWDIELTVTDFGLLDINYIINDGWNVGLTSITSGDIENLVVTGNVTNNSSTANFFGILDYSLPIKESYVNINYKQTNPSTTGSFYGFVYSSGNIRNSFATGNLDLASENINICGIDGGHGTGTISNSYHTFDETGPSCVENGVNFVPDISDLYSNSHAVYTASSEEWETPPWVFHEDKLPTFKE